MIDALVIALGLAAIAAVRVAYTALVLRIDRMPPPSPPDLSTLENHVALTMAMVRGLYEAPDVTVPEGLDSRAMKRGVGRALLRARLQTRQSKKK